jgi:phosphohistidine phosphatase
MHLYFLRHGPAGASETWTGPDSARPLTEDGRQVVAVVAERLARLGIEFEIILTSPYPRAAQTADIVARRLDLLGVLQDDARLEPGFDLAALREILAEHAGVDSLLLVGHNPDFTDIPAELIGGAQLKLRKAGIARVDLKDGERYGKLLWLAQPETMTP